MAQPEDVKLQLCVNATEGAAGTDDINGDVVDTSGFTSVTFVCVMGAIVAGAATVLKAQEDDNDAVGFGDASDLAGTAITIADDDDNKIVVLTVKHPLKRYIRPVVTRATEDATVAALVAVLNGAARKAPITDHADVTTRETHVSPVAGTA